MKIYIAGKITGNPDYKRQFFSAERILKEKGHCIMNPARIGEGEEFSWNDYMKVSKAMQKVCECVYFIPGWTESKGAQKEFRRACKDEQLILFNLNSPILDFKKN